MCYIIKINSLYLPNYSKTLITINNTLTHTLVCTRNLNEKESTQKNRHRDVTK